MSIFSFREFKQAFILFLMGGIGLLALLIPLEQLLPDYFDSWVPDFLANKSIWYYGMEHLNFFLEIIAPVGLLAMIIFLWRKR